jgi:hypothetical protein
MQPNLQVPSTLVLGWLLFLSHLCWKLFRFPFVHNNKRRRLMFIVAFGSKTGCWWPWIGPGRQDIIVVSPSPQPVDCYILPPAASTPRSYIESFWEGRAVFFVVSLLSTSLHDQSCVKSSSNPPSTNLRPMWRLFCWSNGQIDGLNGNGGKGRHQRWCQMALVAIARWFGGHQTWFWWSIDGGWMFLLWFVREKVRYFVRTLTKNQGWRSSLFLTAH